MGIWSATSKLFSDAVAAILDGTPFGAVWPPKDPPPLPNEDGRTHALRALRLYLTSIPFQLPNPPGPDRTFRLDPTRFSLEQPETPKNLLFPSIAVVEGESELRPIGLTPYIDERSANVFGPGTALEVSWEYAERITLEIWADTRALRRSLAAGIEASLSPTEEVGGIRLQMPAYFGQTVRFSPISSARLDGELGGDRRRRAVLTLMMEFNICRLVNVVTMRPQGIVVVTDPTAPG
jgi:hypothetical protein